MKPLLLLAVLAAAAGPAAAEPGRYAAVKDMIGALPEVNPKNDPSYWDVGGFSAQDQMGTCHFKPEDMASMDRMSALVVRYRNAGPEDAGLSASERHKKILAALSELPDFQGREGRNDFGRLRMGLALAPDFVQSSLIAKNCRAMLRFNYDSGASRAQLLGALESANSGGRLESQPVPKD